MEATSAAYPRGVRCTVGLNTPAIITGELPLIILLDEQTGAAKAARSDFTDDLNAEKTHEETFERISTGKPKRIDSQEPRTSRMGNVGDSPPLAMTRRKTDHSTPAVSPAHGGLSLSSEINQYPITVVIRPYGYNRPSNSIYNILDGKNGNVMGVLDVDEGRTVRLMDVTGMHVLTAIGSLHTEWWFNDHTINIVSPSNIPIATICKTRIDFKSDNQMFHLRYLSSTMKSENKFFIDDQENRELISLSEREDAVQLVVHSKLSNDEQFRVVLVHALRALYRQFIHKRPMPHEILANESHAELGRNQLPNYGSVLFSVGGLSLRMACYIDSNHWFADFIFMKSKEIALILAKTDDRYEFRDLSGRTHFIATQVDGLISVFSSTASTPDNTLIGEIDVRSGKICDSSNTLIMDFILNQNMKQNPEVGRWFKNECYTCIIRSVSRGMWEKVKIEAQYHTTAIHMTKLLSSAYKALILAFAASVSDEKYRMSAQIVPRVQHYP